MSRSISFLLVLYAMAFCGSSASGEMVYALENHAADQNGHTLTGSIVVTDTAINDGYLLSSEILRWDWTITGPSGASATSLDANASLQILGDVLINSNQITITQPNIMSTMTNGFRLGTTAAGDTAWYREEFFGFFNEVYLGSNGGSNAWSTGNPGMSGTDPWLVATRVTAVPEPSALSCMAIGALCLLVPRKRRLNFSAQS